MKNSLFIFTLILVAAKVSAFPQYYCTGATSYYFPHLLNLIGSIHKNNFEDLEEIAVFNLGLTESQINDLNKIKKTKVYSFKESNPNLLTFFSLPDGRQILGWYSWKPVAIKEALEKFPYVLWLDAASTVLGSLNPLFKYIEQKGYFVCTLGCTSEESEAIPYTVEWGTTIFVREQFHLDDPENKWILAKESLMSGVIGASQNSVLVNDYYALTKDLRYFVDDGTTPNGFGTGRHDQTILCVLAYLKGLTVHQQDYKQKKPMLLSIDGQDYPLHITWHSDYVKDCTHIYNSRGDIKNLNFYLSQIHYK